MIESIQYYTNHFIVEPAEEVSATILTTLTDLTNRIALDTIVQIAITAPLFYLHYNLFALGFTLGFVLNDQAKSIVDKVNVVYNAQRSTFEKVLLVAIGTPLILITMPTSIVIATLYYSAQWGSILYEDSLQRQPPLPQPGDVPLNNVVVV